MLNLLSNLHLRGLNIKTNATSLNMGTSRNIHIDTTMAGDIHIGSFMA